MILLQDKLWCKANKESITRFMDPYVDSNDDFRNSHSKSAKLMQKIETRKPVNDESQNEPISARDRMKNLEEEQYWWGKKKCIIF